MRVVGVLFIRFPKCVQPFVVKIQIFGCVDQVVPVKADRLPQEIQADDVPPRAAEVAAEQLDDAVAAQVDGEGEHRSMRRRVAHVEIELCFAILPILDECMQELGIVAPDGPEGVLELPREHERVEFLECLS